jgi:hypothetical protein
MSFAALRLSQHRPGGARLFDADGGSATATFHFRNVRDPAWLYLTLAILNLRTAVRAN